MLLGFEPRPLWVGMLTDEVTWLDLWLLFRMAYVRLSIKTLYGKLGSNRYRLRRWSKKWSKKLFIISVERSRVNFINVLARSFYTHISQKCKKTVKSSVKKKSVNFLTAWRVKAARKNVDEIDPWWMNEWMMKSR